MTTYEEYFTEGSCVSEIKEKQKICKKAKVDGIYHHRSAFENIFRGSLYVKANEVQQQL